MSYKAGKHVPVTYYPSIHHSFGIRVLVLALALVIVQASGGTSYAVPSYLTAFETAFPAAVGSRIDVCILCHNQASGGSRNPYGADFASAAIGNHTFNATLGAANSDGTGGTNNAEIAALTFPGDPNDPPAAALIITTTSPLPAGTVGTAYSQTLSATGGTTPYSWSVTAGALPAGLNLNASTGAITGTPTTAGTFDFTVQVSGGGTSTKAFALTINPTAAPTITTASPLPPGTVGSAYSQTLSATGGLSPYSWSVSAGSLPGGLSLNASTGAITGTPTTAGTFNFTIQVTGTNSASSTKAFALTINSAGAPDTTAPTVLSTSPDNNATGVVVTAVSATFSEAISSDNVTTTSFTLTRGVDNVAGSVSVNGAVATFTPSVALADNTTYTATLTTAITDLAGNHLAANYVWTFTTGTTVVPPPPPPISLFGRGGGGGGCAMAGSGSGVKGLVGAYGALMLTVLGLGLRSRRRKN